MSGRLQGKVAFVTGGSGDFGIGIVEKFLEEGARCLILDVTFV
jgi:3-oxoacyl-[acyl-carrier protein] reductase